MRTPPLRALPDGIAKPNSLAAADQAARICMVAATAAPALIAYNLPPSPTQLNQLAALVLWGGAAVGLTITAMVNESNLRHSLTDSNVPSGSIESTATLLGALLLFAAASATSWMLGSLSPGLAWSSVGIVAATAVVAGLGAWSLSRTQVAHAFFVGGVLLGVLTATIAVIQVFAPSLADGDWIARSSLAGRAVGNVRQPNHLATLMLGSAAALVPWALRAHGGWIAARWRLMLAWPLFAAFMLTITLSGSRTGMLGVVVLALWGLIDRRLHTSMRLMLLAGPLMLGVAWFGLSLWSQHTAATFGAATRLAEVDISGSRFAIWRDTLELIRMQPWTGVGFGNFNLAWSMTPFPDRPTAFFDHSHNIVLQLVVELGIPLGLLVCTLLATALWQAGRRAWAADGSHAVALRACFVMVLLMAIHSQLEYPLWYAHLLLPTAFAWGACLAAAPAVVGANTTGAAGGPGAAATHRHGRAPAMVVAIAGVLIMSVSSAAFVEYLRVAAIFEPAEGDTTTLAQRIAAGKRTWFFAHHADYAWATTAADAHDVVAAADGAKHYLLDARLMQAWATALSDSGDVERARHVAARLREFRNPASHDFFAECNNPAFVTPPFQCAAPARPLPWTRFR